MSKKRRILLALPITAVLCGFLWLALDRAEREPMYEGKPLSFWLFATLTTSNPTQQQLEDAQTAIRAMGTNALPTLLRMGRRRDLPFVLTLVNLAQKQHVIGIHYVPAPIDHQGALFGLAMLGTDAACALPELLEIYDQSTDLIFLSVMPERLFHIAPGAKAAIPVLLRKAVHTNEHVRACAIAVLDQFRAEPDLVVPALIKALQDPSERVRREAVQVISLLGTRAKAAVPALLELQKNPRNQNGTTVGGIPIERRIKFALQSIDPEAAAKAGIK